MKPRTYRKNARKDYQSEAKRDNTKVRNPESSKETTGIFKEKPEDNRYNVPEC
ncbi:MAG TPA: hypothetical protein VN258_01950 [Mobilitalea sp.]|nr:hypothetical protein [Mobilitalea sp.]